MPPGHGKPAQPGQLPGAAEEPTGPFKTTGEVDDATAPSDSECVICLGELSIVGKLECCVSRCQAGRQSVASPCS